MKRMLDDWDSSVMLRMVGKNLQFATNNENQYRRGTTSTDSIYLNIVCTATIVLQSASESSSAEFDNSLLTTTTFSATVMPALSKSSRLHSQTP